MKKDEQIRLRTENICLKDWGSPKGTVANFNSGREC